MELLVRQNGYLELNHHYPNPLYLSVTLGMHILLFLLLFLYFGIKGLKRTQQLIILHERAGKER